MKLVVFASLGLIGASSFAQQTMNLQQCLTRLDSSESKVSSLIKEKDELNREATRLLY